MSSNSAPNYKDSLNLPNTSFPMKGDLPKREPVILERWKSLNLYEMILTKNLGRPKFVLPDGPPYANGNLHMGHALNKILKDIVIKYKNMSGFRAAFIPGWDCHGLPIEQSVTKNLASSKSGHRTEAEIRELCRQEAKKWIETQREQFIRYGVIGDWDKPYATLDPKYEADEVRTLAKILKTGAFFRGEKPVYWNTALQTALAEAEVEYKNRKSPSIYVKFRLSQTESLVVWTTTPWTLPANLGVALHPNFEYGHYEHNGEILILAKALRQSFEQNTGLSVRETGQVSLGHSFENKFCQHPFMDRKSQIVMGEHVTLEAGTGCVHTAPGHGLEDYVVGQKYGLQVLSPVDEYGNYTEDFPLMQGKNIFEANPLIIELLRDKNALLFSGEIEHSYPHCWRTKVPLIFRATPQWFLGMDRGETSIRHKALAAIKEVKWIPGWGQNRITGMIENRPDWCLSRQRIWGVPIPVFHCQNCSTELADSEIMNRVADKMELHGGIEAYHTTDPQEFTRGEPCRKCGGTQFRRSRDILDVWFDSGCCFSAVQERRPEMSQPADLYLEGSDQHRGWFHTSLLTSIAASGKAPFKSVLTHGFVMYAKGQKMSKSLGNVVDPRDLIQRDGAEILRLWAAHEDYAQDLTCSPESFQRVSETYRRLRNTVRYILGNTHDFNAGTDFIECENRLEIDRWILHRLNELILQVTSAYENYEFYKIYHLLNNFATVDLSAIYFDVLKDRLYTWKKTGASRRSAQSTLVEILGVLNGLMAPILTFLAEESYEHSPTKNTESILLTEFPRKNSKWTNVALSEIYSDLLKIRSDVSKNLEDLRTQKFIGANLDAEVTIYAEGERLQILQERSHELKYFFITSSVKIKSGPYRLECHQAPGTKCLRCWSYSEDVGRTNMFPGVCLKCVEAMS